MARAFSVKVEGLADLKAAIVEELPKATGTNVQKRALLKAAVPFEGDAKAHAPYKTGTLQEKIDIGAKLSPRAKRSHKKESKVEVFVGPPSMTRGIVAEFGSVKQSPTPFMRPAWDANKVSALRGLRDDLAKEIEKARQRIARKQARLLAKVKAT